MKKILMLFLFAISSNVAISKDIVKLEETKVKYEPLKIIKTGNSYQIQIQDNAIGEFEKDPLTFINRYFDINQIIEKYDDKNFEAYQVSFKSRKGTVNNEYCKKGKLLSTNMKFVNVLIPYDLQHQLYRDHKGWALTKTVHIAKGNHASLIKDYYLLTMKNGNESKTLRINTAEISKRV